MNLIGETAHNKLPRFEEGEGRKEKEKAVKWRMIYSAIDGNKKYGCKRPSKNDDLNSYETKKYYIDAALFSVD